jgi:hypothetical protein
LARVRRDPPQRETAELQAVHPDDDAESVVELLGSGRSILADRKRELIDP